MSKVGKRAFLLLLAIPIVINVMAQETKKPTLEDLIPGGESYRYAENLYGLQWWGDECIKPGIDTIYSIQPQTGKETMLITREQINKALAEDKAGKLSHLYSARFPWAEKPQMLLNIAGKYIVYDFKNNRIVSTLKLKDKAANEDYCVANGNVAYTVNNNLYVNEQAITDEPEGIVCGQSVHRNEFGINKGTFWSPKGNLLAFYRMDESRVTDYPLVDISTRTAAPKETKYPMAGMKSEQISLGVYQVASGKTVFLDVDDFGREQYLTNIAWSPASDYIYVQVLDRAQKHMKLNQYSAKTGEFVKTLLEEQNERYIEPLTPIVFLKNDPSRFIYRTNNRDGYFSLYLCEAATGKVLKRLTDVNADVEMVGQDDKFVYYTSAEVSPVDNHLFRVEVKSGKKTRLTQAEGWHKVTMSGDMKYFVDNYSSLKVPRVILLVQNDGKKVKELLKAEDPTKDYNFGEITLGTVKSADGKFNNYYRLIKPMNFDASRKYPVIVYVYGGPHSQMVKNTWQAEMRRWEMYMAQHGYVVFVMDNRGTSNQGAEFEKAIHGQCGQAEMADQMEGIKLLKSLPYVDADRIGVHGWSYGGFMTISLLTNQPDVFKVAVAGGPVIDWKWYEVMYGERYMDTPQENPEGYAKTSLIAKAKDLKGKLLICQGAVDPVVVWEQSLSFIRECIKNNVQVDYFPYPCAEHNVMGRDRIHLMQKVTNYFEDYLR